MPYADFGENTTFDRDSLFVRLKEKDAKIQFRLLGRPFYKGQHFQKDELGKWNVFLCPKIMDEVYCPDCEQSFQLYKERKKAKEAGATEEVLKTMKDKADYYKATITFFYPILDRSKVPGKAKILECSMSVRNKIEAEVRLGRNVLKFDYILLVTKEPGSGYYRVDRVDSAETQPITPEEEKEIQRAKSWDLSELTGITVRESGQDMGEQSDSDPEPQIDDEGSELLDTTQPVENVDTDEVIKGMEKAEKEAKSNKSSKKKDKSNVQDGEKEQGQQPDDIPF